MSIWARIGDFFVFLSSSAANGIGDVVEAVRTLFQGDAELRRRVAFSVAMIALSAKMAKADGVVTQDEIRAFREIFSVPPEEERNVARLYDFARQDVAGFEYYARRMASLCGTGHKNCAMLEDILDGLFHIAKADGLLHERESWFLKRVSEIFRIEESHYQTILARHLDLGDADPYRVLGIGRDRPFSDVRAHYRRLIAHNHPDRLIARGLPEEFIRIATSRVAAINAAYELIEKAARAA
ncbi:DnaJ like chaperone protein [Pseudaminobacter salicylatoxidans]|uniref:DnaJ like chaperone protein n=1 Tax=Pseudaminobacter salicylatoxidans TaxID=93369 RepID=A0A316C2F2_PSESE|nr:DnaJ family molecular chaperone [Pseudaminobacter salicylatoxidans]PWJ83922.1 DnaJ like chaperone protein [Pseudaminobacter salicylatoxidans]